MELKYFRPPVQLAQSDTHASYKMQNACIRNRGVNHLLEISGNLHKKSEISYALGRNPVYKWEISYAKCLSDLPLGK